MDKWDLLKPNKVVKDFWFEKECREALARLQKLWNGKIGSPPNISLTYTPHSSCDSRPADVVSIR
jgi:hypothetical protein